MQNVTFFQVQFQTTTTTGLNMHLTTLFNDSDESYAAH